MVVPLIPLISHNYSFGFNHRHPRRRTQFDYFAFVIISSLSFVYYTLPGPSRPFLRAPPSLRPYLPRPFRPCLSFNSYHHLGKPPIRSLPPSAVPASAVPASVARTWAAASSGVAAARPSIPLLHCLSLNPPDLVLPLTFVINNTVQIAFNVVDVTVAHS